MSGGSAKPTSIWQRAQAAAFGAVDKLSTRWLGPPARGGPVVAPPPGELRRSLVALAADYAALPDPFADAPASPPATLLDRGRDRTGHRIFDASWDSEFIPALPAARDSYLRYRENRTAHARVWSQDGDRARPAVVLVHGLRAGQPWLAGQSLELTTWLRAGFDVAMLQLPFHGPRAPEDVASGQLFLGRDVVRSNEAVLHAVHDLRALLALLRRRCGGAVGACGVSIGGYLTATCATVEPLAFAVALHPAVRLDRLTAQHTQDGELGRRMRQEGIDGDLLAELVAIHAPLRRPSRVAPARSWVVAGRNDLVTPLDEAQALAAHWRCRLVETAGGHLVQSGRHAALAEIVDALTLADLGV